MNWHFMYTFWGRCISIYLLPKCIKPLYIWWRQRAFIIYSVLTNDVYGRPVWLYHISKYELIYKDNMHANVTRMILKPYCHYVLQIYCKHQKEQLTHLSGQNGRHFADDIFRWIIFNEEFSISIKKNHRSLFLRAQLMTTHHWIK